MIETFNLFILYEEERILGIKETRFKPITKKENGCNYVLTNVGWIKVD